MPWCTEMYWVSGHDATPEKEKQVKSVVRHRVFSYDATPEKENSSEASSNLNPSPTFFLNVICSTMSSRE